MTHCNVSDDDFTTVMFTDQSLKYIYSTQADAYDTLSKLQLHPKCDYMLKVPTLAKAFLTAHSVKKASFPQKATFSAKTVTTSLQNYPPSQKPSTLDFEKDDLLEKTIFPMLLARLNVEFQGKKQRVTGRFLLLLDNCSDQSYITEHALTALPEGSYIARDTVKMFLQTLGGTEPITCDRVVVRFQLNDGPWLLSSFLVVEKISTTEPLGCIHLRDKMIPLKKYHQEHFLSSVGDLSHYGYAPGKKVDVLLKTSLSNLLLSQPQINQYPDFGKMTQYRDPFGRRNNVISGAIAVDCDCNTTSYMTSVNGVISTFKAQVSPKDAIASVPPDLRGDANKLEQRLIELFRAENLDRDHHLETGIKLESRLFLEAMESSFRYLEKQKKYEIGLPWLSGTRPQLQNNYSIALARFRSTENRLMVNFRAGKITQDDLNKVNRSITEHIQSGVYIKVPDQEKCKDPSQIMYFLPLRLVYNYASLSTPVRGCLDASCESGSKEKGYGPSLNACLAPGDSTLPDQRACHVAFRKGRYSVGLDLSRYFLSVSVSVSDQVYQRFVFRELGTSDEILAYQITSVAWGVSSSPQICSYVLKKHCQILMNEKGASKGLIEACESLIDNLHVYADNIQVSIDSIEKVRERVRNFETIFARGGFISGKYCCNDLRGLADLPQDKLSKENLVLFASSDGTQRDMCGQTKLLGEVYSWKEDRYFFGIGFDELFERYRDIESVSKRDLASAMATVSFSHLQFRGPFVLQAKALLSKVCQKEADELAALPPGATRPSVSKMWGQDLGKEILDDFRSWIKTLPQLKNLWLDRFMPCLEKPYPFIVVTFTDSGDISCCAVSYIVSYDPRIRDRVSTFCQARLRSKPVSMQRMSNKKPYTTPRLEFVALHMGVQLTLEICSVLNVDPKTRAYVFSDSTVSLAWAKSDLRHLAIWHANRARDIQQSGIPLRFVYSQINPSDNGTKILPVSTLMKDLWRFGPKFLRDPVEEWPDFDPGIRKLDRRDPRFLDGLTSASCELVFYTSQVSKGTKKKIQKYPEPKDMALLKFVHLRTSMFFGAQRTLAFYILAAQKLKNHFKTQNLPKQPKNTAGSSFTLVEALREARILWYFYHQSSCFQQEQRDLLAQWNQGVPEMEGRVAAGSRLSRFNAQLKFVGIKKLPIIYLMGRITGSQGGKVALDGGHLSFRDLAKDSLAQRTVKDLARQLHLGIGVLRIDPKEMIKGHLPRKALSRALSDQGVQVIRQKFFVQHITSGCGKCSRFNNRAVNQQMAALPKAISNPVCNSAGQLEILRHISIDFFGPIKISKGSPFQRRSTKSHAETGTLICYILLVVDLVSSYLCAYVTPSMTATDTALALNHHFSTYLRPYRIHLDNQSSFHSLADEFTKYYSDPENQFALRDQFSHFYPPIDFSFGKPLYPPNQGKIEKMVHLVKLGLRKIHSHEKFSLYPLNLALADVCGVINSTPLGYTQEFRDAESVSDQLITPKTLVFGEFDQPEDLYTALSQLPKEGSVRDAWKFRQSLASRFSEFYIQNILPDKNDRRQWQSASSNVAKLRIGSIVLFNKQPSAADRELANVSSLGSGASKSTYAAWPIGTIQSFINDGQLRPRGCVIRCPDGKVEFTKLPNGKYKKQLVRKPSLLTRSLNTIRTIPSYTNWAEFEWSQDSKTRKKEKNTERSHPMRLRSSNFYIAGEEKHLCFKSEVPEALFLKQKFDSDYLGTRNFYTCQFPFSYKNRKDKPF